MPCLQLLCKPRCTTCISPFAATAPCSPARPPHLKQASVSEMMATERQLLCCSTITHAILNPRLVVGPLDKGKNLRQGQARSGRPAQRAAAAESRVHIDRPLAQAPPPKSERQLLLRSAALRGIQGAHA